jgi:transcriptional regulator with XRE-family HTH domain
MNLDGTIRRIASEKKLSLEKLAIKSGMTNATLHSIMNKNDAKLSQLISIASVLGVSPINFFHDAGQVISSLSENECQKALEHAIEKIKVLEKLVKSLEELNYELRKKN